LGKLEGTSAQRRRGLQPDCRNRYERELAPPKEVSHQQEKISYVQSLTSPEKNRGWGESVNERERINNCTGQREKFDLKNNLKRAKKSYEPHCFSGKRTGKVIWARDNLPNVNAKKEGLSKCKCQQEGGEKLSTKRERKIWNRVKKKSGLGKR